MESTVVGAMLLTAVVQVAVTAALFAWGRWVARRRGGRAWARAAWLPVGAAVLCAAGYGGTMLGLLRAFSGVAEAPPEAKARVLAEGIDAAMWSTALLGIPGSALYIVAIAVFLVGSLRPGH